MTRGAGDPHESWDELAVGSALHALEPAEEAEFRRHLVDCPRCQEATRAMAEVTTQLALGLATEDPPPRLRAAVLAAGPGSAAVEAPSLRSVGPTAGPAPADLPGSAPAPADPLSSTPPPATPAAPTPTSKRPTAGPRRREPGRSPWQRSWAALAAAAAAVAIVSGAVLWGRSGGGPDRNQLLQQCAQDSGCRTLALDAPGGSRGQVILRGDSVTLVAQGLTRNNPSRDVYVLWQLQRTGEVLPVGTFDVTAGTTVTRPMPLRAAADAGRLAITTEPGRVAPAAPSGPILATANL